MLVLPLPETPQNTISCRCGRSRSTERRLLTATPRSSICDLLNVGFVIVVTVRGPFGGRAKRWFAAIEVGSLCQLSTTRDNWLGRTFYRTSVAHSRKPAAF